LRNSEYPVVVIAEQNKEESAHVFSLHLYQNRTDSGDNELIYLEKVKVYVDVVVVVVSWWLINAVSLSPLFSRYIAPFSVSVDRSLAKQLVR
jgi:hypothetical protein